MSAGISRGRSSQIELIRDSLRWALFVIDFFPDSAAFAATIADPRFVLALAISVLAGLVRGFSGVGSALVYMPLMSALYGPRIAAPSMAVIDVLAAVTFVRSGGDRFGPPLCIHPIRRTDSIVILIRRRSCCAGHHDSGAGGGGACLRVALSGAADLSPRLPSARSELPRKRGADGGPPVISKPTAQASAIVRANFVTYFAALAAGLGITYSIKGLLTSEATALALLIGPLQIASQHVGARLFPLASDRTYRILAYGVILLAALVSMPLLDPLYR
jgi:hypothetical protein